MNAIYNNRIYNVVEVAADITLAGNGVEPFDVSFSDPGLIVEPTDDEVADAVWPAGPSQEAGAVERMEAGADKTRRVPDVMKPRRRRQQPIRQAKPGSNLLTTSTSRP